jgi:pimeloyl-ACP methyl ester carboxylesterase
MSAKKTNQTTWSDRAWNAALGLTASGLGLSLASFLLARQAERRVPADGKFIDIEGSRLHYVDRGSGPAIVMVHGLGGQLRNFTYALTELLERDHRVIVVDRPGSGYSTAKPGTTPGVRDQGRLIARFVDKLGLAKPLVVGHSLGGAVALAAALAAPGRLGGLALLAPLTQPQDDVPKVFRLLQRDSAFARAAVARTAAVPLGRLTQRATLAAVFKPDPAPADFPTRGGGLLALRPANVEANSYEITAARDDMDAIVPRYGELSLPVRILFGRDDNLLDPDFHGRRTAAMLPNGRFEETEGGHMLPVTHPERTAAFVRAALVR